MKAIICLQAAFLLMTLLNVVGTGAMPQDHTDSETVLEKFVVRKNGDSLLIPVRFGEKIFYFALDTGCTCTLFDSSFHLGTPRRTVTVQTHNGKIPISLFKAPKAKIGKLDLCTTGLVLSKDLTYLRKGSGHPIAGLLGMDFLRRHVIRIDFDRGELLFLKNADPNCGEKFNLSYTDWVPQIQAQVSGLKQETFELDTGSLSLESVNLRSLLFRDLLEKKLATVVGSTGCTTASGTSTMILANGNAAIMLGSFRLERPIFSESATSHLGLAYLSRFVVTFDFPNDTLYLKKGKQYSRADVIDRSGLEVAREERKTLVEAFELGSPAHRSGLRVQDVIWKIDGKNADDFTLLEIKRILANRGATVQMSIKRDNESREVTLYLED